MNPLPLPFPPPFPPSFWRGLGGGCEASDSDGAVAHARGRAQRRQGGGDDARYHLQDGLPSFLFHGMCVFHGLKLFG